MATATSGDRAILAHEARKTQACAFDAIALMRTLVRAIRLARLARVASQAFAVPAIVANSTVAAVS
eukprot:CAMPEP_0170428384 /NCGR_PEP_ID=MMETSP0117_2-20130122/39741_1 /TAXON_ID=400756 /ORGANISM="Durinskia baltica, Strain CSIRO CS-38" /LENGTH=65 /DNA_ID=CAMNT_0010687673 /DNA_START=355 /DNA_END=549 /DNA_ORIENTATION=-